MADAKSPQEQTGNEVQPVAPGTVVTPGQQAQAAPVQAVPSPQASQPTPQAPPPVPAPLPPQPQAENIPEAPMPSSAQFDEDDPTSISWAASEFVAHDKSGEWYLLLAVAGVIASAFMYILTRDFVSVAVVLIATLIFGVYASHKPRQIQYHISRSGITVGQKTFGYDEFRSFTVLPEGAFSSIVLMPLRRFAVPITIYYAPKDEDMIVSVLADMLPYEQRRRDAVDSLMRKVRF